MSKFYRFVARSNNPEIQCYVGIEPCDPGERILLPQIIRDTFPEEVIRRIHTQTTGINGFKDKQGNYYAFEWTPDYIMWFNETDYFKPNYDMFATLASFYTHMLPDLSQLKRCYVNQEPVKEEWIGFEQLVSSMKDIEATYEYDPIDPDNHPTLVDVDLAMEAMLEMHPWPDTIDPEDKQDFEDCMRARIRQCNSELEMYNNINNKE